MSKFQHIKNQEFGYFEIIPKPTLDELKHFYQEEFYDEKYKFFNDSSLENQLYNKDYLELTWKEELKLMSKLFKKGPISTLLDIGCGWCQFLIYAKNSGLDVQGLDPSPEASEYGAQNGLKVQNLSFEEMADIGNKFDIVTLKNVLEHVINPKVFLEQIYSKYMKKDSIIQIEVPNEFNKLQLLAKETLSLDEWWIAPPAHLNYFDSISLSKLIESIGLEVITLRASFPMELFLLMDVNYIKNPKLGRECHNQRVAFETKMLKSGNSKLLDEIYLSFAKLGIGRQLTVYARKK